MGKHTRHVDLHRTIWYIIRLMLWRHSNLSLSLSLSLSDYRICVIECTKDIENTYFRVYFILLSRSVNAHPVMNVNYTMCIYHHGSLDHHVLPLQTNYTCHHGMSRVPQFTRSRTPTFSRSNPAFPHILRGSENWFNHVVAAHWLSSKKAVGNSIWLVTAVMPSYNNSIWLVTVVMPSYNREL